MPNTKDSAETGDRKPPSSGGEEDRNPRRVPRSLRRFARVARPGAGPAPTTPKLRRAW